MCLHVRSRWGAAASLQDEPILDLGVDEEHGFVEIQLAEHKTGNTMRKRRKLLPMAGLARGLSGAVWAKTWLKLRLDHGMSLAGFGGCLMPCPQLGGGFSSCRAASYDGALWLLDILKSLDSEWGVKDIGAHCLRRHDACLGR